MSTNDDNCRSPSRTRSIVLYSTPFDLDMYDDGGSSSDDEEDTDAPPLANDNINDANSDRPGLVLGINKYSHDTTLCAADANTGRVLFALSKERQTRTKHMGGNIASLVESCLDELDCTLDNVMYVIMNNHHHRILPHDNNVDNVEWEMGLGINYGANSDDDGNGNNNNNDDHRDYYDDGGGYADEYNLLTSVPNKIEISHHLAHAYSVASQAPFNDGLIVIMDGMGESYRTMMKAIRENDGTYFSDFNLLQQQQQQQQQQDKGIQLVPPDIHERALYSTYDYREAESVYTFTKQDVLTIIHIYKRFTPENTSPALYNHGFANMDSIGAVYSRVSSHIFGDWNACGKVMGLAPWMGHVWDVNDDDDDDGGKKNSNVEHEDEDEGQYTKEDEENVRTMVQKKKMKKSHSATTKQLTSIMINEPILKGTLYSNTAATPTTTTTTTTSADDKDGEKEGGGLQINRSRLMGMPLIARIDSDMFDSNGNMVRSKRYDFDDNDYVVPTTYNDNNNDDDAEKPVALKQTPTRVALDAISLASRIQTDLENVCLDFVRHMKARTEETNLCLAGGVALNSVLNGRLSRELGFKQTFIPPYPGDDGIAVGCCAFGLFGGSSISSASSNNNNNNNKKQLSSPPLWRQPITPYLGPMPTLSSMKESLDWAGPWIDVTTITDENERNTIIVDELISGGVVAVYNGRSELGPRALGHRSILADPRKKGLVRYINEFVKQRESFRPFAPSCLAEMASEWFELGDNNDDENANILDNNNVSPYMSITAQVKEEKRLLIPAVTHVDGSSRLQTVTAIDEPIYHRLIMAFYKATGVPMVLNTSFNTLKSEPIVETPRDAIRSFLSSMGTIELLVMGDFVIRRRDADVSKLLGEEKIDGVITPPSLPIRAGFVNYKTTFSVGIDGEGNNHYNDDDDDDSTKTVTKTFVQMPDRPMHNANDNNGGWFELLDDLEGQLLGVCDGTIGVNEIMTQFAAVSENESYDTITDADQYLVESIIRRLVRLYEHTLISW